MARRVDIETKTEELVLPIIEANNFELVDVEYVKEGANWYLRVYADKEGGIAIDDCVLISRSLEEKLDAEDFIEDAYILEVSSPGLGRPLKKEKDYVRSVGKSIDIKLYKAIDKQKEFTGILKENMEVSIMLYHGETLGVELPNSVELEVTETEPGIKGDTASGGTKPAILETGLSVQVPFFINQGDVLIINTTDASYVSRA